MAELSMCQDRDLDTETHNLSPPQLGSIHFVFVFQNLKMYQKTK